MFLPTFLQNFHSTMYNNKLQIYNYCFCYRYGLNIKTLNDSQVAYTYRSYVYTGQPAIIDDNPLYLQTTLAKTCKLMEDYGWDKLSGNSLTTDNYYSSLDLVDVCSEHNISFCGTLRSNRKGVHQDFIKTEGRAENSTIVWFDQSRANVTLSSYCVSTKSKGKKCVLLLASIPDLPTMGVTKDDNHRKTALFKYYDFSMMGTDVCGKYNYLF